MTVTYTHEVANARLGGFSRLLLRWKGSVYKLFYREFFIFISFYSLVSITYRFAMNDKHRVYFEKLCLQFEHYTDLIPISFVLGFYVSIVVGRWWSQFESIPWPDRLMMIVASNVHGSDERGRLLRRTLLRYLNLSQVLTYRCISTAVYKRFPTMDHVVSAGIMTKNEHQFYDNVSSKNLKYWVPMLWFNNLLSKARQEGRIYDDMMVNLMIKECNKFRGCCGSLLNYDWISVPLVYTQVVTVAVYMFFFSTLISRQYLDTDKNYEGHGVDLVVPIFTVGQFFFYMGWLKVAEQLINPFGEDDDDYELNSIIDRNLEVSLLAVDNYRQHPKLEKDEFWHMSTPSLPYTAASVNHKIEPFMGSTFDMRLAKEDQILKEERLSPTNELTNAENENQMIHGDGDVIHPLPYKSSASFLSLPRKGKRLLGKKPFSISRMSKNSLLHDSSSSSAESSDDGHDEQVSDEEHERSFSVVAESNLILRSIEKNEASIPKDMITNNNSPNETELFNVNSEQENNMESLPEETVIQNQYNLNLAPPYKESNPKLTNLKKQELCSNQFETRHSKEQVRPKKLNLNIQFSTDSTYPMPSSIQLQCNDEKSDDRNNAEKRIHLYERKRRNRMGYPSKKRTRRSASSSLNLLRKYQKRSDEAASFSESTGAFSTWSESDIGSGPACESPMGSLMSCATSIPSPRQLRWMCKPNATANNYGDTTSIASTVTSPSGNECNDQDKYFGIGATSLHAFEQNSWLNNKPLKRSDSSASSGKEDSVTPFADDLRRRLQVVSSSSPAAVSSSPIKNRQFFPNKQQPMETGHVHCNPKANEKSTVRSCDKGASKKSKQHNQSETINRPPSTPFNNNQNNASASQSHGYATSLSSSETKPIRRNTSGIWQAFKTWNTKRKETKSKEKDDNLSQTGKAANSFQPSIHKHFDDSSQTQSENKMLNHDPQKNEASLIPSSLERLELGFVSSDPSSKPLLFAQQRIMQDSVEWESEEKQISNLDNSSSFSHIKSSRLQPMTSNQEHHAENQSFNHNEIEDFQTSPQTVNNLLQPQSEPTSPMLQENDNLSDEISLNPVSHSQNLSKCKANKANNKTNLTLNTLPNTFDEPKPTNPATSTPADLPLLNLQPENNSSYSLDNEPLSLNVLDKQMSVEWASTPDESHNKFGLEVILENPGENIKRSLA